MSHRLRDLQQFVRGVPSAVVVAALILLPFSGCASKSPPSATATSGPTAQGTGDAPASIPQPSAPGPGSTPFHPLRPPRQIVRGQSPLDEGTRPSSRLSYCRPDRRVSG